MKTAMMMKIVRMKHFVMQIQLAVLVDRANGPMGSRLAQVINELFSNNHNNRRSGSWCTVTTESEYVCVSSIGCVTFECDNSASCGEDWVCFDSGGWGNECGQICEKDCYSAIPFSELIKVDGVESWYYDHSSPNFPGYDWTQSAVAPSSSPVSSVSTSLSSEEVALVLWIAATAAFIAYSSLNADGTLSQGGVLI
jgi:hypothetical protein